MDLRHAQQLIKTISQEENNMQSAQPNSYIYTIRYDTRKSQFCNMRYNNEIRNPYFHKGHQ